MQQALVQTDEDVLSQALAYARWALVVPWFLFWTMFCGTASVLTCWTPWRRSIAAWLEHTWGRMVLWAARCPVILEREPGAELPPGGFVYAVNHQGVLDILA